MVKVEVSRQLLHHIFVNILGTPKNCSKSRRNLQKYVQPLTLCMYVHVILCFAKSSEGKHDWLTAINWLIVQLSQVAIIEAVGAIDTTDQMENRPSGAVSIIRETIMRATVLSRDWTFPRATVYVYVVLEVRKNLFIWTWISISTNVLSNREIDVRLTKPHVFKQFCKMSLKVPLSYERDSKI